METFSEVDESGEDNDNLVHHGDADQPKAKIKESDEEPVSNRQQSSYTVVQYVPRYWMQTISRTQTVCEM